MHEKKDGRLGITWLHCMTDKKHYENTINKAAQMA